MTTQNRTKQSVFIVRYGLTEHALVEDVGPFDSDINPNEGIEHAKAIATRIANDPDKPTVVFSSPFLRTSHTASILAKELNTLVKIEEGLTEWQSPSLLINKDTGKKTDPRSVAELAETLGNIDTKYVSQNPATSKEGPKFPEDEGDLCDRCKATWNKLLQSCSTDYESIAIVSHAPCDQALAYYIQESVLPPWPMGGITKFSRTILTSSNECTSWEMEFYGDSQHVS